ncbi:MAG: valine--tRNA ligase [Ezakiella sp.]|nr:valine--tRNA ligase [Ezakiella sp.]MDD7471976.1 valine--tRNA ligase [Bacillota bacterium]MDY3923940.1 valine--tRNA ligase [Ezakiella sp.]
MKELDAKYDPHDFEDRIYDMWTENNLFSPDVNSNGKPYTIMMPPPNVTANLHLGHSMYTLQDIYIRYKRMQGYRALWLPGTDHASIATEARVVNKIKNEGHTKEELGREGFLKEAWEWTRLYGGNIENQLKKMGFSPDWSRKTFTLSEHFTEAVNEAFCNLYNDGLIYRGDRIINWCPNCKTALSDAEVEHEDSESKIWEIMYPFVDSKGGVVIATTRPETMLGDLAVAVNPADDRYKDIIGKKVKLPLVEREIPIIADDYVDMEFGTGVVKITPSHDPNDFEVGERHNLGQCQVITEAAKMADNAGKYAGMDRYEARKQILADLKDLGLLVSEKKHLNSVGHCSRCDTVVEPMLSKQWFVKMETLAKATLEKLDKGEPNFYPKRFEKIYRNWLENLRDWCISRQLWWGHQIPAWYCEDCGHINVQKTEPTKCEKCGSTHLHHDQDTLDTWFSSALWPFGTLGWPDKDAEDLKTFFPTDLIVTAYDILFFWIIRMTFSSVYHMGEIPFKDVLITGLVRDIQGRKMSKSLGNGIDPLVIIDKYGADALRFNMVTGNSPGNDMRFDEKRVEASRNFANKVWNASRYVLMNLTDLDTMNFDKDLLEDKDIWILEKLNEAIKDVNNNLAKYEVGLACERINNFIWEDFCDYYIEFSKPALYGDDKGVKANTKSVLLYVLVCSLKMLHPIMPFITEEIYQAIPNREEEFLIISKWPEVIKIDDKRNAFETVEKIKDLIKEVRNAKSLRNIEASKKSALYLVGDDKLVERISENEAIIGSLIKITEIKKGDNNLNAAEYLKASIPNLDLYMPLKELIDLNKEKQVLSEKIEKYKEEIARLEKKLSNEGFTKNAPENVVAKEREKLFSYKSLEETTKQSLKDIESVL